jgi:anti-anti-sigma regulatory factor
MATVKIDAGDSIEIASVGELKPEWLRLSAGADEVEVDLGAIERIDTAGLQFLLAFSIESAAVKQKLQFNNVSAAAKKAAAQLGLSNELFKGN